MTDRQIVVDSSRDNGIHYFTTSVQMSPGMYTSGFSGDEPLDLVIKRLCSVALGGANKMLIALHELDGVINIYLRDNELRVQKDDSVNWNVLNDQIIAIIMAHLRWDDCEVDLRHTQLGAYAGHFDPGKPPDEQEE